MLDHNCPPESDLQALATGALDRSRIQALESHLLECDACAQRTVELFTDDTLIMALKHARSPTVPATIDEPHLEELMQTFEALHPAFGSGVEVTVASPMERDPDRTTGAEEPPKVLGNYDLLQLIGSGGMGQVFKARHRRMSRIVALKVLHAESMRDPTVIARFEREVKAVAAINHPNIVAAYDADQAGDVHFLVMEYVEGSDLSAIIKQSGPLSVDKAIQCVLQAARGLQAAHALGIVHRDIKPANLLLDNKGTIKILDMGLARFHGDVPAQAELTALGTVMGTVDYMAPEQALDTKSADGRADIYSLGCTLYYLLTGEATYRGDTLTSRLLAHQSQPIPDLRASRPDISAPLVVIFEKMVAKRVSERYRSMADLIADLERLQTTTALRRRQTDVGTSPSDTLVLRDPHSTSAATTTFLRPGSTGKRSGLQRRSLACGAAAALLLGAIIIILKGSDGTNLEVTVNEPDAVITVSNEQGALEIQRTFETDPIRITLKPGKKRIEIQKSGFVTQVEDSVEIKAGEKHPPIRVRLVPDPKTIATTRPVEPTVQQSLANRKATTIPQRKPLPPRVLDKWVQEVRSLPAEEQVLAFDKKMQELNPGFTLTVPPRIANSLVKELDLSKQPITDPSPIRAFPGLVRLDLNGCPVSDLTALQELPLNWLNIGGTRVTNLSPLQGMPLAHLDLNVAPVEDLSPISKLPLVELLCSSTLVRDLTPLESMLSLKRFRVSYTLVSDLRPLQRLSLTHFHTEWTLVSDLSPLRGMPLDTLVCSHTLVSDLKPLTQMPLTYLDIRKTHVADLSPLQGLPLKFLGCAATAVTDLSPLKGMPLTTLLCSETDVIDLSALIDMPLTELNCMYTLVTDLTPAHNLPLELLGFSPALITRGLEKLRQHGTLQRVEFEFGQSITTAEFWKKYDAGDFPTPGSITRLGDPAFVNWINQVSALLPEKQLEAVANKLRDLNPRFDGKLMSHKIEYGIVTQIHISSDHIVDISPVRALRNLDELNLTGKGVGARSTSFFSDLSPLQGMALKVLHLGGTLVADLTPLKGMPLTSLNCDDTRVADLAPLQGMQLESLSCKRSRVSDFSPLKGAPLRDLNCKGAWVSNLSSLKGLPLEKLVLDLTAVSDLSPLEGMKFTHFECSNTAVADLAPLKGMPLQQLSISDCAVTDLSPLKGMDLQEINLVPRNIQQGAEVLRDMMNVTIVACVKPGTHVRLTAGNFLKDYDRGIFRVPTPASKPAADLTVAAVPAAPVTLPKRPRQAETFDQWVQEVRSLPPEEQVVAFAEKMRELNPGFTLKIPPRIASNTVKELEIPSQPVTDLSPVRVFSGLVSLNLQDCPVSDLTALEELPLKRLNIARTRVAELTSLQRLPLTSLDLSSAPVVDLSPISKLPLTRLSFNNTFIQDIAPLQGMSLEYLDAAYTLISDLRPLHGMPLTVLLAVRTQVSDLSPLQGMPLVTLNCSETQVSDLNPLKGMPLIDLECAQTRVADLSPLRDLPLQYLGFQMARVSDLAPLQGKKLLRLICRDTDVRDLTPLTDASLVDFDCGGTLVTDLTPILQMPLNKVRITPGSITRGLEELRKHKTLEAIAFGSHPSIPPAAFWKKYDAGEFPPAKSPTRLNDPEFIKWTTEAAALPAERQLEAVAKKLKELNPKFDGKFISHAIEFETVTRIQLSPEQIVDISPVRAFKGLDELMLRGSGGISRDVKAFEDLSPLQGMSLKSLFIEGAMVSDLTPLKGMRLTHLACSHTRVADLSPLRGMKLEWLDCNHSYVSDLSPLMEAPLRELKCGDTGVSDLSPMKGKPLRFLVCNRTLVSDLSPLNGMPLSYVNCDFTQVSDLSPLQGMKLESLELAHTPLRDLTPIKGMPLQVIRLTGCRISDLSPLQDMDLKQCYLTPRYIRRGVEVLGSMPNVTIIATEGRDNINYTPAAFLKVYETGAFKTPILVP